tara:strand:+ start:2785 stop:2979 length:195 start_codon:yes stop_codon:yes gene_type:complete
VVVPHRACNILMEGAFALALAELSLVVVDFLDIVVVLTSLLLLDMDDVVESTSRLVVYNEVPML